jgi:hypothetical protein
MRGHRNKGYALVSLEINNYINNMIVDCNGNHKTKFQLRMRKLVLVSWSRCIDQKLSGKFELATKTQ